MRDDPLYSLFFKIYYSPDNFLKPVVSAAGYYKPEGFKQIYVIH